MSVCLSVYRQNTKKQFSQKLSNLLTTYSRTWAFQTTHYWSWTSKVQDGGDPPSWRQNEKNAILSKT